MQLLNAWTRLKVAAPAIFLAAAVALAGCGGGGDGGESSSTSQPSTPAPAPATNNPPTIQGQPVAAVLAGQSYSFQPAANDPNGDALTFSVANLPSWASFDSSSGQLTGTPAAADVGSYTGITVSVSDGRATAVVGPFDIEVTAAGTGSATLSWVPPTQNSDGSALADLAGYQIMYGRSVDDLNLSISVENSSISTYVIENLTSGAWYFAITAVNSAGVASTLSNIASKTIS